MPNEAQGVSTHNVDAAFDIKTELLPLIQAWGAELGFSQIGVASVDLSHAEQGLLNWLEDGFHGDMHYMAAHGLKRARPAELVPGTLSVITARMNYLPRSTAVGEGAWALEERGRLERAHEGVISVYARGRDYHKVMRQRLARLALKIQERVGTFGYRVFTDSAPVLEAELGAQSGLGWRGKHTLLLSRDSGSMFFLGEIYLDMNLQPTPAQEPHCGTCRSCIDVCPTGAIIKPYVLDARKCISYLTIEHAGSIPLELRPKMGNHIYGCDDCQTTCPWNKYAQPSELHDFDVRSELFNGLSQTKKFENLQSGASESGSLIYYFSWSEEEFELKTRGTAIRRIGYERWLRNVAIAMGNALRVLGGSLLDSSADTSADTSTYLSTSSSALPTRVHALEQERNRSNAQSQYTEIEQALISRLNHPSPLVVEHVHWALAQRNP